MPRPWKMSIHMSVHMSIRMSIEYIHVYTHALPIRMPMSAHVCTMLPPRGVAVPVVVSAKFRALGTLQSPLTATGMATGMAELQTFFHIVSFTASLNDAILGWHSRGEAAAQGGRSARARERACHARWRRRGRSRRSRGTPSTVCGNTLQNT